MNFAQRLNSRETSKSKRAKIAGLAISASLLVAGAYGTIDHFKDKNTLRYDVSYQTYFLLRQARTDVAGASSKLDELQNRLLVNPTTVVGQIRILDYSRDVLKLQEDSAFAHISQDIKRTAHDTENDQVFSYIFGVVGLFGTVLLGSKMLWQKGMTKIRE